MKFEFCAHSARVLRKLIMFFFGYLATIMDCDSAVLKKVKKISMTTNVLPVQAKIQMLTTSSWIVTILLKSLGLYKFLY
jgi:hypothetical protein